MVKGGKKEKMVEKNSWVAVVSIIALVLAVIAVAVVLKGSVTGEAIKFNAKNASQNATNSSMNFALINNSLIIVNKSLNNLSSQVNSMRRGENFTLMNYTVTNATKMNVLGYVCALKNGKLVVSSTACK